MSLLENLKNLTAQALNGAYNTPSGEVNDEQLRNQVIRLWKGVAYEPVEGRSLALVPTAVVGFPQWTAEGVGSTAGVVATAGVASTAGVVATISVPAESPGESLTVPNDASARPSPAMCPDRRKHGVLTRDGGSCPSCGQTARKPEANA